MRYRREAETMWCQELVSHLQGLAEEAARLSAGDPVLAKLLYRYVAQFQAQADEYWQRRWDELGKGDDGEVSHDDE